MFARSFKRLIPAAACLLILSFMLIKVYDKSSIDFSYGGNGLWSEEVKPGGLKPDLPFFDAPQTGDQPDLPPGGGDLNLEGLNLGGTPPAGPTSEQPSLPGLGLDEPKLVGPIPDNTPLGGLNLENPDVEKPKLEGSLPEKPHLEPELPQLAGPIPDTPPLDGLILEKPKQSGPISDETLQQINLNKPHVDGTPPQTPAVEESASAAILPEKTEPQTTEPEKPLLETLKPEDTALPQQNGLVIGPKLDLFDVSATHNLIKSISTSNGAYFQIVFGKERAINPSIIPHPWQNDTWIIVAQDLKGEDSPSSSMFFTELVCAAIFDGNTLRCKSDPKILAIGSSMVGGQCEGEIGHFALNIGPHDARVFWGQEVPYVMYGSNSNFTCMGMWLSDFRTVYDWPFELFDTNEFRMPTELQRPPPYAAMEKNFFLFWNDEGKLHVHFDIAPKRTFSALAQDGSVGPDLAPLAAKNDEACMAKYMPKVAEKLESIHQATNSLSVTLCDRSDEQCEPTNKNTFIMMLYQYKTYHDWHGVYEPYIALFRRTAPFELFAMTTKPLWINGRGGPGKGKKYDGMTEEKIAAFNETEMVYVSSMSWKRRGLKWHGYQDDEMFLGFGIEDTYTGGIDTQAKDLLKDLALCRV